MKHDVAYIAANEEEQLECEAVRLALVEALLRSRDGRLRIARRGALSSLEDRWVGDLARMLVGEGAGLGRPLAKNKARNMTFVSVGRHRLLRVLRWGRERAASRYLPAPELEYVPLTCGPQGDVRTMSEGDGTRDSGMPPAEDTAYL